MEEKTKTCPYLSNIDKLGDDISSLLWSGFAQHHALDPLGQAVEQCDGPFQLRLVLQ